tara:strand:- start:32 stop:457 length:426 start_codon:yes stop_codon:yes gene_type:complete
MSTIALTLPNPINITLQAKPADVATATGNIDSGAWDVVYFTRTETVLDANNVSITRQVGEIYKLGDCVKVTPGPTTYTVEVEMASTTSQTPDPGDYIFFGKNNKIGTSGVTGYFAEVEMKNDSLEEAELFAVSSEVSVSSK